MHECEIEDEDAPRRAPPPGPPQKAEWPQLDDPDERTFRILIATDIHLGYLEKDPIRGNDSFVTFEEVLRAASEYKADFILLGGDLFHENKPSRATVYKAMELIRKYCFGDKPIEVQVVSDQTLNFPNKFGKVNYEDPNFNIAIPIFSIHGNHDDPAGEGGLAAIDLLSVCNLVNYFGKSDNIDEISIFPILLTKGTSKLALYGLGAIRDERLHRTFAQKKVKFMKPVESAEDWFNIFVLHQNRLAHSPKNFIHEEMIDDSMNLVFWAHEHECLIQPHQSVYGYHITQPGSTIATSMGESEAAPKHVGILEVREGQFKITPVPLKTVRPFLSNDVQLSPAEVDPSDGDALMNFLTEKVSAMIDEVNNTWPRYENGPLPLPLIRLRVDHHLGNYETVSPARFGQRFVGKVANPNDLLLWLKRKRETKADRARMAGLTEEEQLKASRRHQIDRTDVNALIKSYLNSTTGADHLDLLPEHEFNRALYNFVEKDDRSALNDFVETTMARVQKLLLREEPSKTAHPDDIAAIVIERTAVLRQKEAEETGNQNGQAENEEGENGNGGAKKSSFEDDEDASKIFNDERFITPAKRKPQLVLLGSGASKSSATKTTKKKNLGEEEDDEVVSKAKKKKKTKSAENKANENSDNEESSATAKKKKKTDSSKKKSNVPLPSSLLSTDASASARQQALLLFSGHNKAAGLFKSAKPAATPSSVPAAVIAASSSSTSSSTPLSQKSASKRTELQLVSSLQTAPSSDNSLVKKPRIDLTADDNPSKSTPSSQKPPASSSLSSNTNTSNNTPKTTPSSAAAPQKKSTPTSATGIGNHTISKMFSSSQSHSTSQAGVQTPKKFAVPAVSTLDMLDDEVPAAAALPSLPLSPPLDHLKKPVSKSWGNKKI